MKRRGIRTWQWLTLILLVGAALRVAYLFELQHAPDFTQPLADAAFHDYWARGWATGEWTPPAPEPDPRIDEVPYLRPPGYPWFLSLVYRAAGASNPWAPRVAQMLLGVLNIFLAFRLGRALLGPPAALILAAFAATHWTTLYFEGELQAPVLLQTGTYLALLLLLRAHHRSSWAWAALAGIALGLTALVRANALAFVPVAAIWLVAAARGRVPGSGPAALRAAAVVAGAIVALAPTTWRNWQVSGEFVPVSINGAINLYIGNHEGADGESARIPDLEKLTGRPGWSWFRYGEIVDGLSKRAGRDLTYGDVSREFTDRATQWIRANPADFARLSARRAALFWGPREISNNKAIGLEKANSRLLSRFPGFPWVLAISLVGIALVVRPPSRRKHEPRESSLPDRTGLALVGLFVLTMFLSYVPFLAAARFRAPLIPFLFVFGAWAIVRFGDWIRERQWKAAGGAAVAVTLLALGMSRAEGVSDVDKAWWHTDRGVALKRQERVPEARAEFEAALSENPGYIDAHVQLGALLHEADDLDGALAHYLAVFQNRPDRTDMMMKAAVILLEKHRFEDAAGLLSQAVRIVPDSPDAHFELGRALVELGRYEEGLVALDRSLELLPDQAPALTNRGIALGRLGRNEEAIVALQRAVDVNPFLAEAFFHLGNAYHAVGDREDAIQAFDRAGRIGLAYVEPRVHLGNLYNEQGEWAEAIRWYEDALRIQPEHMTARYNVAGSLANAGRWQEAADHLEAALKVDPTHALCRQRLQQIRAAMENDANRAP